MTLLEALCVLSVIFMMLGMLLPALGRSPRKSPAIRCLNNLKNIGLAFRIYATDHQDRFPMASAFTNGAVNEARVRPCHNYYRALSNELSDRRLMICPGSKKKPAASFSTLEGANLTYFAGLVENPDDPALILAGDTHLLIRGVPARAGVVNLTGALNVEWDPKYKIHAGYGYFVRADGSAQSLTAPRLRDQFTNSSGPKLLLFP